MALRLYNTLSGKVEELRTAEPGHVRMYVCGMTVYDYPHMGHLRKELVFDVLVRHLRASDLKVTYVRNVTDINERIIQRAADGGETPLELAARMTEGFREDFGRIGIVKPDLEPCVSEHLPQIHALIQRLIDRGAAYESQGDVYFAVEACKDYGKLSHRKLDELQQGASGRVSDEETGRKRSAADFALWKRGKPGEPTWDSPWGPGLPGWHIECSAMAMEYLGETFDLHGGGLDLVFPHHENEIAQSEAATGKPFSTHWMHNGFLEVNKAKMSKSLGNFFTARESFRLVEPEGLRYFVLTAHWRAPINLDWEEDAQGQVTAFPQFEEAERRVEYLYSTRRRLSEIGDKRIRDMGEAPPSLQELDARLQAALDDDLNTPQALAILADFLKEANEEVDRSKGKKGKANRASLDAIARGFEAVERRLGLGGDDPEAFLGRVRTRRLEKLGMAEDEIDKRIADRLQARAEKDFERADAIRNELLEKGIELMDGPAGTTWRIP